MQNIHAGIVAGIAVCCMMLTGCATVREASTARCYNLKDGKIVTAIFYNLRFEHGKIAGTMPDGEKLEGEFTVVQHSSFRPRQPVQVPPMQIPREHMEKNEPVDWSVEYGFGQEAGAVPVGTAILIGNHGTVLEVVLYTINTTYGYGDGFCKDNNGNRYRIYIGEDESIDNAVKNLNEH